MAKDFRAKSRVEYAATPTGTREVLADGRRCKLHEEECSESHAHRHRESALVRSDRGEAVRRFTSRASQLGEVRETSLHAL